MELRDKLLLLQKACRMCEKFTYITAIDNYMKNKNQPVKIMLVGEGNQGKTTLLNGLVGKEVAKAGYGVKTANQNYYRNTTGTQSVSLEDFTDEDAIEIQSEEELSHLYDSFRKMKNKNVYWSLHLKWPTNDIILIDTEGFNQANDHFQLNESKMNICSGMDIDYSDLFDQIYSEADIIVWCVKGEYCNSTIEKYKRVQAYKKPIFLIYTGADEELENEDLEEIKTPQDLVEDMRMRLGAIAKDCIKDFAGFAGDSLHLERKENFLCELRNEIDNYMKNCENGVKEEIGERLFQGIFEKMKQELQLSIEEDYEVWKRYYDCKDKLTERIENIRAEYSKRICDSLDMLNQSIPHETYYAEIHRNCGSDRNKSFTVITEKYNEMFAKHTILHETIDEILPEKMKVLEEEFLLCVDFIQDNISEEIDFSILWEKQKTQWKQMYNKASGWFRAWKPEVFREYFHTLKSIWTKTIETEFTNIQNRYETGFKDYIETTYQMSLEVYGNNLMEREDLLRMLKQIEQENIEEVYVYALHEEKVIGIFGEHNKVYSRLKEKQESLIVEKILMKNYIEKDFIAYEQSIITYFDELKRITDDIEEAFELLEEQKMEDIISLPRSFEDLSCLQETLIFKAEPVNLEWNFVQKYYSERKKMLRTYYTNKKDTTRYFFQAQLMQEVNTWIFENAVVYLEKHYEIWKNGFWDYMSNYRQTNEFKLQVYYDFLEYLKKQNEDSYGALCKSLYIMETDAKKEELMKGFFLDGNFSKAKKDAIMKELKRYIKNFKQLVENEKKYQYAHICSINKEICIEKMEDYLKEVQQVALKISCCKLICVDKYDDEYSIKRKVENLSSGITASEKYLLLKKYSDVKKEVYKDIIGYQLYGDIEKDLEKNYNLKMSRILSQLKEDAEFYKNF